MSSPHLSEQRHSDETYTEQGKFPVVGSAYTYPPKKPSPKSSQDSTGTKVVRPHTRVPSHDVKYLDQEEIDEFLNDLDHNGDGFIEYAEVEAKLDAVHDEIQPEPQPYNLHHNSASDQARHAFLRALMATDAAKIPREDFRKRVRKWRIPSMKQEKIEEEEQIAYMKNLPKWRRFRSWWAVSGPKVVFVAFVVGMELAFGLWQLVKYVQPEYRAAFGFGVVMAKTSAGFLYPTMFFLVLSMSRYFSTILRKSYHVSKYINWDLSQEFHIYMSILAIVLATLHAIGHLSGTFYFGSQPGRAEAIQKVLGMTPESYASYVQTRAYKTGIPALTLFYILALLSMPRVRKWKFEVFQLGHMLMYPIIGLLCAHGTSALLQFPMLGYFLAFPTLLVFLERAGRLAIGFQKIPATLTVLDKDTVEISTTIPSVRIWNYRAGQYAFVQVPAISFWQWHPFTISECVGNDVKFHIKMGGNWTKSLMELAHGERSVRIEVGVDAPYGAPAERFYDFSHSILVGSGIGVTPFSGILRDLQTKDDAANGGPADHHPAKVVLHKGPRQSLSTDRLASRRGSTVTIPERHSTGGRGFSLSRVSSRGKGTRSHDRTEDEKRRDVFTVDYRRVDFHWTVRDKSNLLWFQDLLNGISHSQQWHHQHDPNPHLDIRIQTHVTQQRQSISTHIYRWLLELHRTEENPESPLTGLVNSTHFGRPDFIRILDAHYEDIVRYMKGTGASRDKLNVGVFYCGAPVVGEILADRCRMLTAKGVNDGTGIRYTFMTEVFE